MFALLMFIVSALQAKFYRLYGEEYFIDMFVLLVLIVSAL